MNKLNVNIIKDSYSNGKCPDCGEPIPDNVTEGQECKNCEHVFCSPRDCDDEEEELRRDEKHGLYGGKEDSAN